MITASPYSALRSWWMCRIKGTVSFPYCAMAALEISCSLAGSKTYERWMFLSSVYRSGMRSANKRSSGENGCDADILEKVLSPSLHKRIDKTREVKNLVRSSLRTRWWLLQKLVHFVGIRAKDVEVKRQVPLRLFRGILERTAANQRSHLVCTTRNAGNTLSVAIYFISRFTAQGTDSVLKSP